LRRCDLVRAAEEHGLTAEDVGALYRRQPTPAEEVRGLAIESVGALDCDESATREEIDGLAVQCVGALGRDEGVLGRRYYRSWKRLEYPGHLITRPFGCSNRWLDPYR
jgi:hypothetical protein